MTINRTEYESYQIINVDSMGFVEMGDDPPCYWWLVIRCDSEWDRWKYGKANPSQGPFRYTTSLGGKRKYHSIIKELWA